MSSKAFYPSLSPDGWVSASVKTADYIMSCFLLSDQSQSYIYNGNISSFPWILQHTAGDMLSTLNLIESTLSLYLGRYFNNVSMEVVEVPNPADPSAAKISIFIEFTDLEGITHNLGRLLTIANLKLTNVININNGGVIQ